MLLTAALSVAALGMHLLVFEEMTYELRVANRRLPTGVRLSAGCSEVIAHADDIMARIREADEAMYRSKQNTKSGTAGQAAGM